MNKTLKVILFGIVSGLIWSLAVIFLHIKYLFFPDESVLIILLMSIVTGVIVSFALKVPLEKCGALDSLVFGLLALPLGAFIFGFFGGISSMFDKNTSGVIILIPLINGFFSAFFSVTSLFYLFPVAVLTTFILRMVIRSGSNNLSLKH